MAVGVHRGDRLGAAGLANRPGEQLNFPGQHVNDDRIERPIGDDAGERGGGWRHTYSSLNWRTIDTRLCLKTGLSPQVPCAADYALVFYLPRRALQWFDIVFRT